MIGRALWFLVTVGIVLSAIAARNLWSAALWLPLMALVAVLMTVLALFVPSARPTLTAFLARLRQRALLFWALVLLYICTVLTVWVVRYQPSRGRWLEAPEITLMLFFLWILIFVVGYGMDSGAARQMGGRIARSPLSGVMVMLTTIVVLFWGAEGALRLFYITPDGYGLTAMSYLWNFNYYWGNFNSVGYRDNEPLPDAPGLIRVAVIGDSFAAGHGIDNAEDMFAHRLEAQLGAGYDVNLIAQPGYDMEDYTTQLAAYPYRPDIVVLSTYLNDIEPLLEARDLSPNRNFRFPQNPFTHALLRNFCSISAVYYLLFQLTNTTVTDNFANDLIGAYQDEAMWNELAAEIDTFIAQVERDDAQLIVLVWPSLVAMEASTPAVERLGGYFAEHGATVIDFSALSGDIPQPELVVNRFDFHPSIKANEIAANALVEAIRALP